MSLCHRKKLVMLYGPPAVGKLTVGKEVAKHLSATLFHNHLTYDLATALLGADSSFETRRRFACRLRLDAISLLLESEHRNIVTTFCYEGPNDDWYVDALKSLCTKYLTTPYFVQLKARHDQLIDRVENPDRRAFGKLNHCEQLAAILQQCPYRVPIRADNHLCIDTSDLLPDDAAIAVAKWTDLAPSNT
ncbi:AAA family ATPase [Xanthomonas sp. GPE 39]|uniref:AAA family ATPase n=1 Tax=Xanthomonas sp. GPE 39 TaxID=1583099 RepID=UPI0009E47D03|nr:AAA family ATPase [Xanthomonas sp. GPE 39]